MESSSSGTNRNAGHHVISNTAFGNTTQYILSTAIVEVLDANGLAHRCKCLLDSGSQNSFVSEDFAKTLQLPISEFKSTVIGISQTNLNINYKIAIRIASLNGNYQTNITCFLLKQISSELPKLTRR